MHAAAAAVAARRDPVQQQHGTKQHSTAQHLSEQPLEFSCTHKTANSFQSFRQRPASSSRQAGLDARPCWLLPSALLHICSVSDWPVPPATDAHQAQHCGALRCGPQFSVLLSLLFSCTIASPTCGANTVKHIFFFAALFSSLPQWRGGHARTACHHRSRCRLVAGASAAGGDSQRSGGASFDHWGALWPSFRPHSGRHRIQSSLVSQPGAAPLTPAPLDQPP